MCILVHQPAGTTISEAMLKDFFDHNPDGFGAMFSVDNKIEVIKTLACEEEVIKIYNEHVAGKEAIIHFRMKTHGDIDLNNCHPYRVTDDIWLAHNGILSEGNPVDKTKSDTWHYIEYILRPALTAQPELLDNQDFIEYLGSMIGSSNKFGLLRNDGKVFIVNKEDGVEHEGLWLSNTYAWTPHKFGFYKSTYSSKGYGRMGWWNDYGDDYQYGIAPRSPQLQDDDDDDPVGYYVAPKKLEKITKAAYNSYTRGSLFDWVIQAPEKARIFLSEYYNDQHGEICEMVDYDPEGAAEWIADLFDTQSVSEADLRCVA